MEKFLVEKYGIEVIDEWIEHNAKIFSYMEENSEDVVQEFVFRISKQAECYQSSYYIDSIEESQSSITILHCGIWDYRGEAEKKGVQLTFDSPCTKYCTKLISAMAKSKGIEANYKLFEIGSHHGCQWVILKK